MIKLTTLHGGNDLALNPAHIASVQGIPHREGAAITMANSRRYEVQENVAKVHQMIEDLRQ